MSVPAAPRYPFGPFLAAYGAATVRTEHTKPRRGRYAPREGVSVSEIDARYTLLAELLGVSRQAIWRWVENGIPEVAADRAACAIGLHPSTIWGDLWWEASGEWGWEELERSWGQWRQQRSRNEYAALDAASEADEAAA